MSVEGDARCNEENIPLPTAYFNSIQSLPQEALEIIMSHLRYSEVCRMGTLCRVFRRAAISVLYSGLRNLIPQILKSIIELQTATKDNSLSLQEHLQNAFLQTVLLILLGEARMFSATYLRYLQQEPYVNIYAGGSILDELYYVLYMARSRKISRELEPELSTRLLTKAERFYEMFEDVIEPALIQMHTSSIATPLFVKLMDVLDCCQTSNFKVSVTHSSGKAPYEISAYYELRDFNTLESPPQISDDVSNEAKLPIILHYIRSTVRWNNIFHPLRALWELDETATREGVPKEVVFQALVAFEHRCNAITSQLFPSNLISKDNCYGIQQSSTGTGPCRQEFTREIGDMFGRPSPPAFGLTCSINMCITDAKYLPIEYRFLIEPIVTNSCSSSSRIGILREKTKYPTPVSSVSVISPFFPMINTGSSSPICLTAKDTLSRVSEILSSALKQLDKRARKFDMASKSCNYIEKELTSVDAETRVKSDGCIHTSISSLNSSEEINKLSSKLKMLNLSKSSSGGVSVQESMVTDTESVIAAVGSSKFDLDSSSSGCSSSEAHQKLASHFAVHYFQMEMRVWRPLGAQSNLSSETVIAIKHSCGNTLNFSQDEIVTNRS